MSLLSTKEILSGKALVGQEVTLAGWIRTRRDSKAGFSFLAVNDGSGFDSVQVIANNTLENYESDVLKLTTSCGVVVDGIVQESQGQGQSVEVVAKKIVVTGFVEDPDTYPMSAKRHSVEYLREYAHLRPRTNLMGAVMRIRNTLAYAIHSFFQQNGFMWVATPLITGSDCEGAGEMFTVTNFDLNNVPKDDKGNADFSKDFFGKHTYMTVSGQLNVETYACAFSKVYTFGPTFRAENSNTTRHLAEFWMIEPEMAFCDLEQLMDVEEDFLKSVLSYIMEQCDDELAFLEKYTSLPLRERMKAVTESEIERVRHEEVIRILKEAGENFEFEPEYGQDIAKEHEKYLTEKYFKAPVFVYDWPKDIKAFYMYQNDDGKTVAAVDLLVPGAGELMGGSQREVRYDLLKNRMDELGISEESLWWYLNLRKYGGCDHSGFGMGFERLLMYVTGMENIRDVIPFHRTPGSCEY